MFPVFKSAAVVLRAFAPAVQQGPSAAWAASASIRCFASAPSNAMALIKQLRERSGAPISDVKGCLEKEGWDMDKAYEALRKKGLAAAAKKASRHAAQGLAAMAVAPGGKAVSVVEVNSETDFVARNELFLGMLNQVAESALNLQAPSGSHELNTDELLAARTSAGASVSDAVGDVAAKVRENVKLRRGFKVTSEGHISTYVHQSVAPGLGRIASIVVFESQDGKPVPEAATPQVAELGQQLAMHVAGMKPQFLDRKSVPQAVLDHERQIIRAQAANTGKPEAVIAKMVEGRLGKFYEEACLVEQKFFLEDNMKVQAVVDRLSKSTGAKLKLATFLRVQCGEGIQQTETTDFATEVQQAVAGTA